MGTMNAGRRRQLVATLMVVAALTSSGPLTAQVRADDTDPASTAIADPRLAEAIGSAPSDSTRISVEVFTYTAAAARADIGALGGIVTGSVPGEELQVSIPAGQVQALAASDAVQTIRRPLIANRPVTDHLEYGPTTGENVSVINASAWQAAGITGAGVRVGIVDFFDLSLWNPAEQGPVPDAAHRMCLDTSGSGFCPAVPVAGIDGEEHGVAVAEVIKDMAPDAQLYLATVGTASDLRAAIDWFSANGVLIMTRSLGAAYDGPGDGTGPLDAVVDYATTKGITWFNSAGNDAAGGYGRYSEGTDANGYVDFQPGPGVDTSMHLYGEFENSTTGYCTGFDGVRWSDWGKSPSQMTDYSMEIWIDGALEETANESQAVTGQPLEMQDFVGCSLSSNVELRIRRIAGGDSSGDIVEVGLFMGALEHSDVSYSAAKPVVDSRSPSLVAVGAVDPATSGSIAFYSSQGPTNDGRTKPDMSAPSCVHNSIYSPACFNGTSAASPSAAGMAALLYQRGLAGSGVPLAALTKHLVTDLGTPGPDDVFGSGRATLPAPPPAAVDSRPSQFVPLASPTRILDTRADSATPGAHIGPHPQFTLIDLPVGVPGATAVAISIVSVDSIASGYIQALPKLMGSLAASSNLN
ncbi:MAG: hypothetical protein JWN99_2854, partial [Ilumatobacteraceae bacterium]|nr:hypothetical protein [Ilumatobacteraceae bacterium]